MPRSFNGSSAYVQTQQHATNLGNYAIVAIGKVTGSPNYGRFYSRSDSSGNGAVQVLIDPSGNLGGVTQAYAQSSVGVGSNVWGIWVWRHGQTTTGNLTSGVPRASVLQASGSWTHGNASSGAATPVSQVGGSTYFGCNVAGGARQEYLPVILELVLVIPDPIANDSDAVALGGKTLAQLLAISTTPLEAWPFSQASTATPIEDLITGLDQTAISGTSVVTGDDPPSDVYAGAATNATVTAVVADATGAAPPATVTAATHATVTAVVASATGDNPAATVAANSTVTAVTATALGSAPPANQILSSVVNAPAVVALGSAPAATVGAGGDATVTGAVATGLGSSPIGSLSAGQVVVGVVADGLGSAPVAAITAGATIGAVPAVAAGQATRASISPAPAGGGGTALVAVAFAEDAA
jgi:hypothetical protein